MKNYAIKRETEREFWRLQGFPDVVFDKAKEAIQETSLTAIQKGDELYKQAGNAVTINVIYEIARRMEVQS